MKTFIIVWVIIQLAIIGMVNGDINEYKRQNKCIVEREYSLFNYALISVLFPLAYVIPINGEYPMCDAK